MRPPRILLAAWAIAAASGAFGIAGAQEGDAGADAARRVNPLSSLDLDSLEATRSLPLFTPSRSRPPVMPEPVAVAVEAAPPPPPSPPPAIDLVGLIMTESTKLALLRDHDSGEIHRLGAGEAYDGWAVGFVDARTVELRNDDRVQRLTMFETFEANGPFDGFAPPFGPAGFQPPQFTGAVPPEDVPPQDVPPESTTLDDTLPDF